MKNVKQADINVTLKKLFRYWLQFTKPFHKLPNQKQQILSLLLYYHYNYKKEITNDKILWKMVFDYDTKLKIRKELGISDQVLQNNLTWFRKNDVVVDNTITPVLIPELEQTSKNFKIIFNFNIVDD